MVKIIKSKKKVRIKAKAKPSKPSPLIEKLSKLIDKFGMSIFENPGTLPLFLKQEKIKPKEVTSAAISEAARLYHDQMEQLKHRIAKLKGSYNGRRLMIENGEVVNYRRPVIEAPSIAPAELQTKSVSKIKSVRKTRQAQRQSVEKKEKSTKDKFGTRTGTQASAINAAMTTTPQSLKQIAKVCGLTKERVKGHMKWMIKRDFTIEIDGKYKLKGGEAKKVEPKPKKKIKVKRRKR